MIWKTEWWKWCKTEYRKKNTHKKNEDSPRDLWNQSQCTNIRIIGVPKEEERDTEPEKVFKQIIAENVLNMGKERVSQVLEAQRIPGRINPRRNIKRLIVINLTKLKDKDKI